MSDPLKIKQYIRTVNDFPIDGIAFRDITSLIETPVAFVETCEELTRISKSFDATSIASIESRGFIFDLLACEGAFQGTPPTPPLENSKD